MIRSTTRVFALALACKATALLVAAPCTAATPGPVVRSAELRAMAAARQQVAAPDRFDVSSVRVDGPAPSSRDGLRLTVVEVSGPNVSGLVTVKIRVLVDEVPRGELRAIVRGRVRGPALSATRTLRRGIAIEHDDLILNEADLTRLSAPPLREPSEAVGLVPVRTLGRDRVLTAALVEPAPLVRRGDVVDVAVISDGLTLKAGGIALRDGKAGDVIPIENSISGAVLDAAVQPDGSLRVMRRTRRF